MDSKKLILITIVLIIASTAIYLHRKSSSPVKNDLVIGILQTASHPALDAARDSFIAELKNKIGDSVTFVLQNAQGSIANAHAIAEAFSYQ